MTSFRLRILAQTLPFLLIAPIALAQTPPGKAPTRGEAAAALNQPAHPGAAQYTRQQIDQLVAPIALYPDELLSQVLMAATYPQQVVEAAQWVQDPSHKELKGDALAQALEPLPWDPSVKALVPFPQILVMMSDHIEWTEALGVAFTTQQTDVMARVQALRHLAMKSGKLKQVKHLTIREEGPAIVIASAEPDRVYVPVYNPTVVYGAWPDREAPPVFLPPPQGFVAETIEPGFEISSGYAVVAPLWGWSRPDWRDERITVNRTEYTRITRDVEVGPGDSWRHNGPVVLVAPTMVSRTTTVTTNVPAGTVAPARAAAVVALPQRAAAQPNLIQTRTSTTETTTRPGQTTTTTAQPSTTRPGQTTTTAQPNTAKPGQTSAGSTQPSGTQPSTPTSQPSTATSQPSTSTSQPSTATSQPSTAQPGQASTKSSNAPARATTTEPSKTQSSTAQPTTARPEEKQAAPSSGTSETGKTGTATNQSPAGQKLQPGKTEANTGKANERSARHPESATNPSKEEGTSSSASPNRLKEAAPANATAKPPQSPTGAAEERAKGSAASPQMGGPERSGSAKPSEAEQPRNRGPHENGGATKPGHEEPSRSPERSGGMAQPEPQHSAKQAPEHTTTQPSAASQPAAPNAGREHEVGHGSSNAPGSAAPNAQPSAQKAPGAGAHPGRSEEKEKKEH